MSSKDRAERGAGKDEPLKENETELWACPKETLNNVSDTTFLPEKTFCWPNF